VARTVFEGEEIEEFPVEILGVYEDFIGPDLDVILGRLVGDKVAHTGVVAGMSGSPVYSEGRLMGALAYRIGSFAKEPLVGITPIEKMLATLELPDRPPSASGRAASTVGVDPLRWRLPLLPEDEVAAVDFLELEREPPASAPEPLAGGRSRLDGSREESWRPIDTPLQLAGIDPAALGSRAAQLRALGLLPVQAGAAGRLPAAAARPTRFEPGSPIAAQLARGDVEISATGTLTYLSEGRVLAFGHPFLRSGWTEMPFAPARVLMTVPSLDDSFKVAAPGDSIGALRHDRLTAVAGAVGEVARMIPVRMTVASAGAPSRQVSFEVVQDPLWGPLVLEIALAGSLTNALDFSLPATVELSAALRFAGQPEVRLANLFSGPGAPVSVQQSAVRYLASVFSVLYGNRFEVPRVESIEVRIAQRPERDFMVVEELWLSREEAAPGEPITARVFLRPFRGERTQRDVEIRVPEGLADGTLAVLAGGGQAFLRRDQKTIQRRLAQSEDLSQMIGVVGEIPRYDALYVRLMRRSGGGILKDRMAPGLPLSALEVLRSSAASSGFAPHDEEILAQQRLDLGAVVFGGRQGTLRLRRN
jgi:hypothetical protein